MRAILDEARQDVADRLRHGIQCARDRMQANLRAQTQGAGRGPRLENAWQKAIYTGTRKMAALWPYIIVYRDVPNGVEILRVWYGAQDR